MPRPCLIQTLCAVALTMMFTSTVARAGDCAEPFGACCLLDGSCVELSLSDCDAVSGVHQGRDSACAAATSCVGACCRVDTGCELLDANDCAALAGFWHGPGSACGDLPCGFGACCIGDSEGTCVVLGAAECALTGGIHFGDGTDCTATKCDASRTIVTLLAPGPMSFAIDQFDPQGGARELLAVRMRALHHSNVLVEVENLEPFPIAGLDAETLADHVVMAGPLSTSAETSALRSSPPLDAADGAPCSGPDAFIYEHLADSTSVTTLTIDPAELAPFLGTGTLSVTVSGFDLISILGAGDFIMRPEQFVRRTDVRIAYLYEATTACPEDIDGSGSVDFGDVLAVLSAWGACAGCPEDLDLNGTVDFNDLLLVLSAWGDCPA